MGLGLTADHFVDPDGGEGGGAAFGDGVVAVDAVLFADGEGFLA